MSVERRNERRGNEQGVAVITAVLASVVMLALSLTAFSLSIHNQDASGLDRDRVRAIHAAEAGIDAAISRIQLAKVTGSNVVVPCDLGQALGTTPPATFNAEIEYFATWPVTADQLPMPCDPVAGLAAFPAGATIDSVGEAGRSQRRMDTAVRLMPLYGQFNKALFSNGTPAITNQVTITGERGAPADVYTNGDWLCSNKSIVRGSVYAQGRTDMGNKCEVSDDLWVGGSARMANETKVGHNFITSFDSIVLENAATVGHRAVAYGTCTGCVLPRVDPALVATKQTGTPPPPKLDFPEIYWNEADWTALGYTIVKPVDCAAARDFILNQFSGSTVKTAVRIEPACKLTFSNNTKVVLGADLAIVTDGSLEFVNKGDWSSSDPSVDRTLHLIVPYNDYPTVCTTPDDTNGDITKDNNTNFINLKYFVYSPCDVNFSNNNASSSGQVYGGTVHVANQFELNYAPVFVPGVANKVLTGLGAQIAFLREIQLGG